MLDLWGAQTQGKYFCSNASLIGGMAAAAGGVVRISLKMVVDSQVVSVIRQSALSGDDDGSLNGEQNKVLNLCHSRSELNRNKTKL